jgi:hypothetical protein
VTSGSVATASAAGAAADATNTAPTNAITTVRDHPPVPPINYVTRQYRVALSVAPAR